MIDYTTLTYSRKLHQAKHEISPEQTGSGLFKSSQKSSVCAGNVSILAVYDRQSWNYRSHTGLNEFS